MNSRVMSLLKRLAVTVALLGSTATVASAVSQGTAFTKVIAIQSGYVVDRMLVFPVATPLVNPGGCTILTNGYIIKETDPARRTFYDMLINAVVWQRDVAFVIDGCFADRPRIVSVSIRRP